MPGESQVGDTVRKRCFVVMGFGVKTDFATGRKLDLDKSYRLLIKPAVEERGLLCVRSDEIRHTGAIDVLMYQELLTADLVIADLSTANPNALYELGLRHALRPHTTVVISENKLPYPFDLNHIAISSYTHLGAAIDYEEVMRFRKLLGETLDAVLKTQRTDSPIYTFLQELTPPVLSKRAAHAVVQVGEALQRASEVMAIETSPPSRTAAAADETLARIIEQGEAAIQKGQFERAKAHFQVALDVFGSAAAANPAPQDSYLVQRLVFATYKAEEPDRLSALNVALELLSHLDLEESNDPETMGLAGAIEKRLFEATEGTEHLARAIEYYGRGFYLRSDRYSGINLAYLLNVRTDTELDPTDYDKIADLVCANRLRRDILKLCGKELEAIRRRTESVAGQPDQIVADQQTRDRRQQFWCLATKAEAHIGLGEFEAHQAALSEAQALDQPEWMLCSAYEQITRLRSLLKKYAPLLHSR